MATKRDYAAEAAYKHQPEQIKKRSENNKARRAYEKLHGPIPKGMDIDHIKPLSKGGSPVAPSNLRAVPASTNRSFSRNADNSLKSQKSKREAR